MNLTTFTFYKNTPLVNVNNTIHFKSNSERDNFFNTHYNKLDLTSLQPFNFRRDRGTLKVAKNFTDLIGYNYCSFIDTSENRRYYAYVANASYLNDKVTQVDIIIDVIMTFCQGHVLETIPNVLIERQHLTSDYINSHLDELRNNDDILACDTLRGVYEKRLVFTDFWVVFLSTADLQGDFGNEDAPKMQTASGIQYDKIVGAQQIYALASIALFNELMKKLNPFPWITQNITKITLIPKNFIDASDWEDISVKSTAVKKLKSGRTSKKPDISSLNMTQSELLKTVGLKENELYLLRSNYCTIEFTDLNGQKLNLDAGLLNNGIDLNAKSVIGYHNEIRIYQKGYNSRNGKGNAYLDNCITFSNFDELPIAINQETLQKAQSAYSRELAQKRLGVNRAKTIFDGNASPSDRFFNATATFSNVLSGGLSNAPSNILGMFSEEYEYNRDLQAQYKQLEIAPPSISGGENKNSLLIANDDFGLMLRIGALAESELNEVRKYYKRWGFMSKENSESFLNVESMSIMNYLKGSCNVYLPNIDPSFNNEISAILEAGLSLWHNNDTDNPMTQNILENEVKNNG